MRFMSMVKSSEDHRLGPPPQALMEAMDRLGQEMTKAGVMVDMGGLLPSAMGGYRVRVSRGKLSVTDGPFSEAKEVIGGYWMIQAKSKEEVVGWAKRCPAADGDVIEIRQVFEMSDFPADVQKAADSPTVRAQIEKHSRM